VLAIDGSATIFDCELGVIAWAARLTLKPWRWPSRAPIRRGGESQVDQMRGRCYVRAAGFGIGAPIAAGAGL
jgi:hypothetical protein